MNIGIAINCFESNQKTFEIINTANQFIQQSIDIGICGFFENISNPCIQPLFPTFPMHEIWGFRGEIIANDLKSAQSLLKLVTGFKKRFYVWNPEWIYMNNPNFEKLLEIYNNQHLEYIVRSESHANLLGELWGQNPIVSDFDIEKIFGVNK